MSVTSVTSGVTSSGLTISSGNELLVQSGGTASSTTVEGGGSLVVNSGGKEFSATILSGGSATILGSATGDLVYGNETVSSGATVTSDTVYGGGLLTVDAHGIATNATLSGGGTVVLATATAALSGTLTFEGGDNTLTVSALASTGGDKAVISGFSATDEIDVTSSVFVGSNATLTVTSNGGTTSATVTSGTSSETFLFSGTSTYTSSTLALVADGNGGVDIVYDTPVYSTGVAGLTVGSGQADYVSGGTVTATTVQGGGLLTIGLSAVDSSTTISAGGNETVYGSANGDQIYGTQLVSAGTAVVTNETVYGGGNLDLFLAGAVATGTTVENGGFLNINGHAFGSNTTLSGGGTVELQSPKATLSGTLTFAGGGNTLEVSVLSSTGSSGLGDQAIISGFSSTDNIEITALTSASLSVTTSGGNTIAEIISGGAAVEAFKFSGTTTYTNNTLYLSSAGGVVDLDYNPNPPTLTISSGTTSSGLTVSGGVTLTVQSGGTASSTIVDNGGTEIVSGTDVSATISAGGSETVFAGGSASGGQIYGSVVVSGGSVSSETVLGGGTLAISGTGTASNMVLDGGATIELESPTATLSGSLTFANGDNTLIAASIANSGDGDQAVISGFSTTDQIIVSGVGTGATLSFSTSAGNEVVTVSGGGSTETFIFSGTSTYTSNSLSLAPSGGAVDLEYSSTTSVTTSTASGAFTENTRDILLVLGGGSVSAATIDDGGSLVVNGGADYAATILAGGTETVSAGAATGDAIYGNATVDGGAEVAGETVEDGGTLVLSGASTATDTTLVGGGTVELELPTATLAGSLTFSDGGNTLDIAALSSSGDGDQAVISGFSSTDKIVISGVGSGATLSFSTSGGNETVTVSGGSGAETFVFSGTSTYTSNTLSLVSSGGVVDLETSVPTSNFNIPAYNPSEASTISAGPLAIYGVAVDSIAPTQMNEGFTEVGAKAAGFDLITSVSALEADLVDEIEPVVIGPGGQLYLLDGHHTFTALLDSVWGADNPTVYVNVIANYSGDTAEQFIEQMQANNWLLPLNDGVPQTVNPASGSISPPIPTSLTGLTSDVYRGLEYSILKQKDSKLFTTGSNITGSTGASTPGLDKMTGIYSDFLEAAAYQDADGGLGLPYLSPGDVALSTDWNLDPASTTTLPNFSGTVLAAQLPGFILNENLVEGSGSAANTIYFAPTGISNATLAGNGSVDSNGNSTNGALAGNGTFTAITEFNAGTPSNPIWIGSANVGFILQLGNDNKFTVTLTGPNTYTGGTTILAGRLIIAGDSSLGAAPSLSNSAFNASLTFDAAGVPTNVLAAVQADNGIIFNSLTEGNATLTIGTTTGGTFTTSRPIAVGSEAGTIDVNGNTVTLNGPLITLGYDGVGLGVTSGFSPLTIDDLSSGAAGTLILSTPSPYFYGDIIIGNVGTPTVDVLSDAALGYDGSNSELVGTVELNGGTLQTGASFTASERNINLEGGSQIDVDGNTTTWGSLTDVKRTLEIENSNAAQAGAITFNNFTISQTSILQLAGPGNETVTFTNGILQTAPGHPRPQCLVLDRARHDRAGVFQRPVRDARRRHRSGLDRHQRGQFQGRRPLRFRYLWCRRLRPGKHEFDGAQFLDRFQRRRTRCKCRAER